MSRSELWTRSFTFVATGVLSTLGYQWLYYQGAGGGGMAMTSSLPNYIGMLLALGSPKVRRNFLNSDYPDRGIKQIMITSLIDVIGSALTGFGLFYTGSGVYQIIYSSVVIFTALLSKFIIKKPLNTVQWACVILVNVGLALSASSLDTTETSSHYILFGSFVILIGTVLIALAYVLDEKIVEEFAISGESLCVYTGIFSSFYTLCYMGVYTVPRWETLMSDQVREAGGSWDQIAFVFGCVCFFAYLHNISYFYIVEKIGSLTAGVLQSLRAVLVFYFSSLLYCSSHTEQCLTMGKSLSAFVVIIGVVSFIVATSRKPSHEPLESV